MPDPMQPESFRACVARALRADPSLTDKELLGELMLQLLASDRKAIEMEREACAKMADAEDDDNRSDDCCRETARDIAANIRARPRALPLEPTPALPRSKT